MRLQSQMRPQLIVQALCEAEVAKERVNHHQEDRLKGRPQRLLASQTKPLVLIHREMRNIDLRHNVSVFPIVVSIRHNKSTGRLKLMSLKSHPPNPPASLDNQKVHLVLGLETVRCNPAELVRLMLAEPQDRRPPRAGDQFRRRQVDHRGRFQESQFHLHRVWPVERLPKSRLKAKDLVLGNQEGRAETTRRVRPKVVPIVHSPHVVEVEDFLRAPVGMARVVGEHQ